MRCFGAARSTVFWAVAIAVLGSSSISTIYAADATPPFPAPTPQL